MWWGNRVEIIWDDINLWIEESMILWYHVMICYDTILKNPQKKKKTFECEISWNFLCRPVVGCPANLKQKSLQAFPALLSPWWANPTLMSRIPSLQRLWPSGVRRPTLELVKVDGVGDIAIVVMCSSWKPWGISFKSALFSGKTGGEGNKRAANQFRPRGN